MSAIVCGKRSIFDDLPATPQVSKRIRFSSSSASPIRFSPSKSSSPSPSPVYNPFVTLSESLGLIDYLKGIFPDMDPQVGSGVSLFPIYIHTHTHICMDIAAKERVYGLDNF